MLKSFSFILHFSAAAFCTDSPTCKLILTKITGLDFASVSLIVTEIWFMQITACFTYLTFYKIPPKHLFYFKKNSHRLQAELKAMTNFKRPVTDILCNWIKTVQCPAAYAIESWRVKEKYDLGVAESDVQTHTFTKLQQ